MMRLANPKEAEHFKMTVSKDGASAALNPGLSYYGTCQACFGAIVVQMRHSKWAMVLHGYRRPGDGRTHGRCWGDNQLPYELSCEITKTWLAYTEQALPRLSERLKDLRSGAATRLFITLQTFGSQPRIVEIGPDYKGDFGRSFDSYLQDAIYRIVLDIRDTEQLIETLTKRVAEWKFNPQALLDAEVEKVDAKGRAAVEARRARQRFARQWREAWKHVAEAVRVHKDLTTGGYFHGVQRFEEAARLLPAFVRVKATRRKRA